MGPPDPRSCPKGDAHLPAEACSACLISLSLNGPAREPPFGGPKGRWTAGAVNAAVPRKKVIDWLLEPEQPSTRYLTLTRLIRKSESDSDVRDAKARTPAAG